MTTVNKQKHYLQEGMSNYTGGSIEFFSMVDDGLTRGELKQLIEKRPALWKKFESWVSKLPKDS